MDPKTLQKISYGMYIVCSKKGEKFNGQVVNTLFQITSEPKTLAVSVNKENLTHEFIESSQVFTASILNKDTPLNFIGQFGFKSGRNTDKFLNVKTKSGINGAPVVLDNALGYFEVQVVDSIDVGTHTVFIGNVTDSQMLSQDEPMTYDYYHTVKNGTSPKAAPTYIKPE